MPDDFCAWCGHKIDNALQTTTVDLGDPFTEGSCTNCAVNSDCDKGWISKGGCPYWMEKSYRVHVECWRAMKDEFDMNAKRPKQIEVEQPKTEKVNSGFDGCPSGLV